MEKVYLDQYPPRKNHRLFVLILNIYGAKAISLPYCVRQDTKSEQPEMDIIIGGTIFTQ